MSCVFCKKTILGIEEKVICNTCKVNCSHGFCIKVEANKPGRKPKWVCPKCKAEHKGQGSDASEDEEKKGEKTVMEMLTDINKKLIIIDKIEKDTSEIKELKHSVEHISKQYDDVLEKLIIQEKNIKSMNNELKELKEKVLKRDNEIEELNLRVQDLEQRNLSMNIEIHGLPATTGENTREVVERVAKVIGAPPVEQSVEDCYRVYANPNNVRKQGIPPIVVMKFKSTDARRTWLDRGKTRNLTIGKVMNTQCMDKLFVCEHLTPDLKRLFFKARSAAKARNWKFVWIKDGKILAKKVEDQGTIRIRSDDDIERRMPGPSY